MPLDTEILNWAQQLSTQGAPVSRKEPDEDILEWVESFQAEQPPADMPPPYEPAGEYRDVETPFEIAEKEDRLARAHKVLGESILPEVLAPAIQMGAGFVSPMARILGKGKYADEMNRWAGAIEHAARETEEGGVVPDILQRGARGAAVSLGTMVPAAMVAGPYGAIAAASAQEANQAITEGRDTGLKGTELAGYAVAQGVWEGIPAAVMQRVGLGGLESIIGKRSISVGIKEGLKEVGISLAQEVPEELITELGHAVAAKIAGVDPNALDADSLKRMVAETTVQTFIAVGMGGVSTIEQAHRTGQAVEIKSTIKSLAAGGKAISRSQWKKLGLPQEKGVPPPQSVRKEVIQALGQQFEAEDAAKALEAQEEAPTEPMEAEVAPEVSEIAPAPAAAPEAPGAIEGEAVPVAPEAQAERISLTKARSAEIRQSLGLEAIEKADVEKWDTVAAEVEASGLKDKAVAIAREAIGSKRMLTTHESLAMVEQAKVLVDNLSEARVERAQAKEVGSQAEHRRAEGVIEDILDDIDVLTRGSTYGRRENARAMSVGQYVAGREDTDLASLMERLHEAKGPKRTPTAKELSSLEKASEKHDKAVIEEKQIEEADRITEEKAEVVLAEKVIKATKPRKKVGAAIREKAKVEQEDIKKRIRAMGYRVNDVTGVSVEGLYLMGRLGASYVKEGAGTLIEVAENLRKDLPDLNITELDAAKALITRNPKEKARRRSESAKTLAHLKTMSQLMVRIDGLANGIDLAIQRKQLPASEDIKKLQKELKGAIYKFYESRINAEKLENSIRKASELIDDLDAGAIRMKESPERKEVPPELARVRKQVRELQREMEINAEINNIEKQVRTGNYDAPVKQEKKPISERLERKQIEVRKLRRELQQIITTAAPVTVGKVLKEVTYSLKAVAATADMSFTMRQNLWPVFVNPVHAKRAAFGWTDNKGVRHSGALKAFFSEYTADQINNAILHSENAFLYEISKLVIMDAGSLDAQQLSEVYRGKFIENFKIFGVQNPLGWVMSASSRHAVAFSNLMRTSAFDHFIANNPNATREEMKMLAWYINVSTGVGDLGRAAAIGDALQVAFFSPKFAVSRFQTPYSLFAAHRKQLPRVRNRIAKDLVRVVATGAMILKLAALAGAEIAGWDPEDPDWGKIRWGNIRIDIWGGLQQPTRMIARLGKIAVADAPEGDPEPIGILSRFAAFKLSPWIAILAELGYGKTAVGEDVTRTETLVNAVQPLVIRDIKEVYKQEGAFKAAVITGLVGLGVGVTVYEDSETTTRRKMRKMQQAGNTAGARRLRNAYNKANPDQRIVTVETWPKRK